MRISLIQLEVKLRDNNKNTNNINLLINKKIPDIIDLVIFPELWNTGYCYSNIKYLAELNHRVIVEKLKNIAMSKKTNLLTGSMAVKINNNIYKMIIKIIKESSNVFFS